MSTAAQPIHSYASTRPLDVTAQPTRKSVTICSIYPGECFKQLMHNGFTDYILPAAPRGSYSLLTVYDTQQFCMVLDPAEGQHQLMPRPVPAQSVAESLVTLWAGDTLGKKSGYSPGIGIIAGDVPTDEELARLRAGQSALFNWYILQANGLHISGKATEITDIHRLAAKEMLDKGAERLAWFPVTEFADVKNCVACGKQINATALRCEHCTTMLPEFYMQFGIEPVGDPAVSAFIERIQAAKAKPVAPEKSHEPKLVKQ